jgi:hypothetical protein
LQTKHWHFQIIFSISLSLYPLYYLHKKSVGPVERRETCYYIGNNSTGQSVKPRCGGSVRSYLYPELVPQYFSGKNRELGQKATVTNQVETLPSLPNS